MGTKYGWIENSDNILLTDDWDDTFKERLHTIYTELGGTITDSHYNDIYEFDMGLYGDSNNNDIWNNNVNENKNDNEQEESDDTQQYPKRTREQVINDRYISKQQKTRQHKKLQMEKWIRIQKGLGLY